MEDEEYEGIVEVDDDEDEDDQNGHDGDDGGADDDDDEGGEEVELTVDVDGRVTLDGGELDYSFRSFPHAFPELEAVAEALLRDCEEASSVREQSTNGEYSEGDTFFFRADATPRVRLESIVKTVFDFHTRSAQFDPTNSGAEWWVQVLNPDDDIGFHFDKDYSLESAGLSLHPHVATVTYLTSGGGPTLILPLPGPLQHGEDLSAELPSANLSFPQVGKHTSFDGRFLHSAPSRLRSLWAKQAPAAGTRRVTLLVNIWLNHVPASADELTDDMFDKLSKGKISSSLSSASASQPVASVDVSNEDNAVEYVFRGEAKQAYKVRVPLPAEGSVGKDVSSVELVYRGDVKGVVERLGKRKRGDGPGEEGEEEEGEDDDDDDSADADDEDEDGGEGGGEESEYGEGRGAEDEDDGEGEQDGSEEDDDDEDDDDDGDPAAKRRGLSNEEEDDEEEEDEDE